MPVIQDILSRLANAPGIAQAGDLERRIAATPVPDWLSQTVGVSPGYGVPLEPHQNVGQFVGNWMGSMPVSGPTGMIPVRGARPPAPVPVPPAVGELSRRGFLQQAGRTLGGAGAALAGGTVVGKMLKGAEEAPKPRNITFREDVVRFNRPRTEEWFAVEHHPDLRPGDMVNVRPPGGETWGAPTHKPVYVPTETGLIYRGQGTGMTPPLYLVEHPTFGYGHLEPGDMVQLVPSEQKRRLLEEHYYSGSEHLDPMEENWLRRRQRAHQELFEVLKDR